jgi:hypothetical protein
MSPLALLAQQGNRSRGQGYIFVSPLATTPRYSSFGKFQVGFGGEGFVYKGLGMGAEVGYMDQDYLMGSTNVSYHFWPRTRDGKVEPFVTTGATFFHNWGSGKDDYGANAGGGINIWLHKHAALRLEVRDIVTFPYGPQHTVSIRFGITFK